MKLSKIFIIVLALHVVVIGGILGYHFFKSKSRPADTLAKTAEQPRDAVAGNLVADGDSQHADLNKLAASEISAPQPATSNADAALDPSMTVAPMTDHHAGMVMDPASATVPAATVSQPEVAAPTVTAAADPAHASPVQPEPVAPAEPVAANTTPYEVRKGDSLYKIARSHGVSLAQLQAANPGVGLNLSIGQTLQIPAGVAPVAKAASVEMRPAAARSYTVVKGDTLVRIARQHGVSVKAIQKSNRMTGTTLRIGQKLAIPASGKAAQAAVAAAPVSGEAGTHVVAKGESLYKIARMYKVTTGQLISANNIQDATKLKIGQKLVIPGQAAPSASAAPSTEPVPVAPTTAITAPAAESASVAGQSVPAAPPVIDMARAQ